MLNSNQLNYTSIVKLRQGSGKGQARMARMARMGKNGKDGQG